MLIREYKLKPSVKQAKAIDASLWQMVSVYNTALTKMHISLTSGQILSEFDLMSEFRFNGKRAGINQDAIKGCCKIVHKSFWRWIKKDKSGKRSGRPRRKSKRNKIISLNYSQSSRIIPPKYRRIRIPGIGKIRCNKYELPDGKIKCGRLIKRASGYYFQYIIDTNNVFTVKENANKVGIDPGFKSVVTMSDGTKFENPKELEKSAKRLAQAQRGKNKKLVARIQERIARQKRDRNHKLSRKIVENYSEIYVSDDNLKGMQKKFGKSIAQAAIGQLFLMISYKAQNCGRKFERVNSKNTTRACSVCLHLSGPSGLSELGVRNWNCNSCGTSHDRDVNAARNVLISGMSNASGEKVTNNLALS